MRIAVTGSTGCIGSHVVNDLIQDGHEVVSIVRNIDNFHLISNKHTVVNIEIGKEDGHVFESLGRPDVLLDLAWENLDNYMSLLHVEKTLVEHYNFIKQLVESGLKSVVVTGTCFEYGLQYGALSESMQTMPTNPYGYAKDSLRKQLELLRSEIGFNITWLRLFYIYGNEKCKGIYSQLIESIKRGDVGFNMSKGEQIRDYISINDLSKSIANITVLNRSYGVVNICDGNPISVRSIVESWVSEYHSDIELNLGFYKYPEYESLCFWGDNSKMKSILE